jgi:hypothetical protein
MTTVRSCYLLKFPAVKSVERPESLGKGWPSSSFVWTDNKDWIFSVIKIRHIVLYCHTLNVVELDMLKLSIKFIIVAMCICKIIRNKMKSYKPKVQWN